MQTRTKVMNETAENAVLAAEVILESGFGQIALGFSVPEAKRKRMNSSFDRGGVFIGRSGLVLCCPCKLFGSSLVFRCSRSESSEWMSTCPSPNKEGERRCDFPVARGHGNMENKESVINSWEIQVLEATYIQSDPTTIGLDSRGAILISSIYSCTGMYFQFVTKSLHP